MPLPPLTRPDARVGLFGGTFDPPHLGHLALARAALDQLHLDHLFFLPTATPPLRPTPPVAPISDRLDLLQLLLDHAPNPKFAILDLEASPPPPCVQLPTPNSQPPTPNSKLEAPAPSHYTIDTLRTLRAAWPRAQFIYLLGSDQFAQLDRWREPLELCRLTAFAVLPRPSAPSPASPACYLHEIDPDQPEPPPALKSVAQWTLLAAPGHPASSSEIRRRRHIGEDWHLWLPPAVTAAIEKRRLYL